MSCERCEHLHGCWRQCMDLPEGCTCAVCIHINRCAAIFGAKPENTQCDFYPVRFKMRDESSRQPENPLRRCAPAPPEGEPRAEADPCYGCRWYPPGSGNGKPCTQCEPGLFPHDCYQKADNGEERAGTSPAPTI